MDRVTRAEIERIAAATLRDAGLTEPPLSVEKLLQYVQLHRDYYDLANPGFLDRAKHKLRIDGHKLVDIINKVRLQAVLLFDENRICIDQELPKIKHPWASCHETGHRLLPWHKPFFFGDTAQTLDPNYQADLEAEANYAAGRLLFLGNRFTEEAKDLVPTNKSHQISCETIPSITDYNATAVRRTGTGFRNGDAGEYAAMEQATRRPGASLASLLSRRVAFRPSFQRLQRSRFVQFSTNTSRTGEAERLRNSDSSWSMPEVIGTSCVRGLSTTSTTF